MCIRDRTIGDYARGILTKNTENTNIFYLTLCLSALTDTNPNLIAIEQINSQNTNITAMTMKEDSTYNNKGNFLKLVNTTDTYICLLYTSFFTIELFKV